MPVPSDNPELDAAELLDALPYGVLVVRIDGTVVSANAPAHELAPALGTSSRRSCRDLFACQGPGGPCEGGCFVAGAAAARKPVPEVRIDTAGGIVPGALWVTVSPLPGRPGAILHLRPGWRGDRRRRSQDRRQTGPEHRIRVLGRTRVEALGDSLDDNWLSQRPGQVLKYLVCERKRIVMVDEIAESIWPDSGRRAVGNTRYAIHRLRGKLEPRRAPHLPPAFVVSSGSGGYTLDRDRLWIDADEFERAVDDGRAAMMRLDPAAATQHLERAMGLYGGPFLADEPYADWAREERDRLTAMASYALRILTALAREDDDMPRATRHLQRLADVEPLDSGVHRELVQALLSQGLRSDAMRRYASFANRLRREFGEEPDFDLRSLSARNAAKGRA